MSNPDSRQAVGDEQQADPLGNLPPDAPEQMYALMQPMLLECADKPPWLAVGALLGSVLTLALAEPKNRAWLAEQLRAHASTVEALGMAQGDAIGAVVEGAARLQAMGTPPAGSQH